MIASALSQLDFVNTPKMHRKRKIHAAFFKGNIPTPRNVVKKRPFVNKRVVDYSPPSKRAKLTNVQRRGNIPASRSIVNRIKKRYDHMRTKRFDNEEWRKHNKLAILTFQLAQIEFHLNTWKSITTCRLDPTRNDSRQQVRVNPEKSGL